MRGRLLLVMLGACVIAAPSAEAGVPPDVLTAARQGVVSEFGSGSTKVRGVRCARTGSARYRCSFGARNRFRYVGSVRIRFFTNGVGVKLHNLAFRYRGSCGDLGPARPRAIRTSNVKCLTARRLIFNWYSRAKTFGAYRCSLHSSPATARCARARRSFTFKYPE